MPYLNEETHRRAVQALFSQIAGRYDLLNRLMTGGQDIRWRQEAIQRLELHFGERVLDLGAGTGDLSFEVQRQAPAATVIPADFTRPMMLAGRARPGGANLPWLAADGLRLPFAGAQFEAVVSGFLMRNVSDLPGALREQYRVLKPGGRIVILDTTRPPEDWRTPFFLLHLRVIIPLLGRLIARHAEAYRYLPRSTEAFLSAEQLALRMQQAGFRQVSFRQRMAGAVAIHWGKK